MTVLNEADAIRLGERQVVRVYAGGRQVWPAPQAYKDAVLADNPVAYYRLGDESGNARDMVGGPDGAWSGSGYTQAAPSILPSGEGAAARWDTSGPTILIPDNPATRFGGGGAAFSAEMWVRFSQLGVNTIVEGNGLILMWAGYWLFNLAGLGASTTGIAPPEVGVTYHFAFSVQAGAHNAQRAFGYMNGSPIGTFAAGTTENTNGLMIGGRREFSQPMRGSIQELGLYNYAVSSQQVQAHYAAGGGQ